MGRSCYAGISVNFFIAAAFLLLFGITAQNNLGAAVGGTKDGATARGGSRTRVQRPLRRLSGP